MRLKKNKEKARKTRDDDKFSFLVLDKSLSEGVSDHTRDNNALSGPYPLTLQPMQWESGWELYSPHIECWVKKIG